MDTYETVHEKTYVAGKEYIKSSIIKALSLVIGFDLFIYIVNCYAANYFNLIKSYYFN